MTHSSSRYAKVFETAAIARLLNELAPARQSCAYAYRTALYSECLCVWERVMTPLWRQAWQEYRQENFPAALKLMDDILCVEPNAWAVCAAISRKVLTARSGDVEQRRIPRPFDAISALSNEMRLCCGLEACRNALPAVGKAYFEAVDWRTVQIGGALSEIMRWMSAREDLDFLKTLWLGLSENPFRDKTSWLAQFDWGRFAFRLGHACAKQHFLDAATHCNFSMPVEFGSLLSGLVRTGSLSRAREFYRQFLQGNAPLCDHNAHYAVLAAGMGIVVVDFDQTKRLLKSASVQSASDFGIRIKVCSLLLRISCFEEALACLNAILPAVEVDPSVAGLVYSLGRQQGKYDWAMELLQKAEDSPTISYRKMQVHFAFGHVSESAAIVEQFLNEGLDLGGVLYFDRAEMAIFHGDWAEAVALQEKFLSCFSFPEVFTDWIWMGHFHLALLLLHTGDPASARKTLEIALRQYHLPENACAALHDVLDFRQGQASPTLQRVGTWEACADILSDEYFIARPWLYIKAAQWYARLGDREGAWRVLRRKVFASRSFLPGALDAARQSLGEGDEPQFLRAAAALGAAFSPFAAPGKGWRAIMELDVLADCPPADGSGEVQERNARLSPS